RSRLGRSGLALAVTLFEAGHPAAAVQDLLLAGVERVALRANLDHDATSGLGAARLEGVAASAEHCGLLVGGMNVRFHAVLFDRLSPWPAAYTQQSGVNSEPRRFWGSRPSIMPGQPPPSQTPRCARAFPASVCARVAPTLQPRTRPSACRVRSCSV